MAARAFPGGGHFQSFKRADEMGRSCQIGLTLELESGKNPLLIGHAANALGQRWGLRGAREGEVQGWAHSPYCPAA